MIALVYRSVDIRGGWVSIACVLALTVARPSYADSVNDAREHYKQGRIAFDLGHYEDAIIEYEQAYKLKDDPAILFNIAQAHRLAGHLVEALQFYRSFLRRQPDAFNREEVEGKIAEMQRRIATQHATGTEDPDSEIARRHFEHGAALYDKQQYEAAITEFEEARHAKPAPALDFNIARAYDRLEKWDRAIEVYERYLHSIPTPADAKEITARIEALKKRQQSEPTAVTPSVTPVVESPPPRAIDTRAGRTKK